MSVGLQRLEEEHNALCLLKSQIHGEGPPLVMLHGGVNPSDMFGAPTLCSRQPSLPPTPDPALQRLAGLVGEWTITGRPLGAKADSISGKTRFSWLDGNAKTSFFLQQDMELDYDGQEIKSHELIGHDSKTKRFTSLVYSNMAPDPWPYEWDVDGDDIRISIHKPPMDATFTGKFAADGKSFSGGWRPNRGADEAVNAPYDLVAKRIR